ncbi:hypothetical protein EK21DRAFT_119687 [Setomelanomma holmii]|uniref:Uncharacterized protein n=1 Tax=Setomelanomma holmii TaxID=210430 RepID=A0A9P4GVZ0_9PLEO|nr:hypothetical protein EK21DRAFT_119687 [Setomelanomma holmii]
MSFLTTVLAVIGLLVSTAVAAPVNPNTASPAGSHNEETCGWLIDDQGNTQLMISTPTCHNAEEGDPFHMVENDYCAICYTYKHKNCSRVQVTCVPLWD